MNRCGIEHVMVTSPVDEVDGFEVVECIECGQPYVVDGDTYVPIQSGSLVDAGAWDGHNDGRGLMADPYWGRLDEP